jgi:hypothetical protein
MQHSHSEPVFYPLSHEGFQVWLGTRKLSSHPPSVFFDHIHGKTILNWHSSHHRFPACYARRIDWDACAAALHRLPLGRRRWVSKQHTSGFCSVGTMLVRWQEQPTSACPRCDEPENARHVWQCQEPAVFFVWALLMSSLSKWLEKLHTANDIISFSRGGIYFSGGRPWFRLQPKIRQWCAKIKSHKNVRARFISSRA